MTGVPKDIRLARKWPSSKVQDCLDRQDKSALISFLRERYEERFFKPIRYLKKSPASGQGYGFAMMALCSLLVESIQCCRDGLPSTNSAELSQLANHTAPTRYAVPKAKRKGGRGRAAFQDFFNDFTALFPGVEGGNFYDKIRNGLLHQGQTKDGWVINVGRATVCDAGAKVIDRNLFAESLQAAFNLYLTQLQADPMNEDLWKNAKRRIWWLIRLSATQ